MHSRFLTPSDPPPGTDTIICHRIYFPRRGSIDYLECWLLHRVQGGPWHSVLIGCCRKAVAAEVCSSKCGPWTHGIRKSCWKYRIPGPTADFWMKTGHLTRPPGILTHPSSRSPTETGGSHAWRRTRIPDLCGNTRGSPHHPSSRADSGVRWAQGSEFLSSYLPALI